MKFLIIEKNGNKTLVPLDKILMKYNEESKELKFFLLPDTNEAIHLEMIDEEKQSYMDRVTDMFKYSVIDSAWFDKPKSV